MCFLTNRLILVKETPSYYIQRSLGIRDIVSWKCSRTCPPVVPELQQMHSVQLCVTIEHRFPYLKFAFTSLGYLQMLMSGHTQTSNYSQVRRCEWVLQLSGQRHPQIYSGGRNSLTFFKFADLISVSRSLHSST